MKKSAKLAIWILGAALVLILMIVLIFGRRVLLEARSEIALDGYPYIFTPPRHGMISTGQKLKVLGCDFLNAYGWVVHVRLENGVEGYVLGKKNQLVYYPVWADEINSPITFSCAKWLIYE